MRLGGLKSALRGNCNVIPAQISSMVRIIEIDRLAALSAFRPAWSELLRQTPGASFFQSLEWLEVLLAPFRPGPAAPRAGSP